MRISFVLPYAGIAGGIRVCAIYAQRLQARGHDVFVVSTPARRRGRRDKVRSALVRAGVLPDPPRQPSHFDGVKVRHVILPEVRPVADGDLPDADVVIATWWETAEWVNRLSPRKGAKAFFIQHHEVFPEQPRERVEATWRMPLHKITISQWLVDLARERYGDPEAILVENGVDTAMFHAPARGRQPGPTVGFLYCRGYAKGCDVAIRAIERARAEFPTLKVRSFGAEEPVKALPLPRDAEFELHPAQDRIRRIYSELDVWLCGSRAEGFHLPPLEAMACRTPVVSTRVGGSVETVRSGVNGFLCDVGDDRALAEGLGAVLSLPEPRWRDMSEQALLTAGRFTWDTATDKFERALAAIAARGTEAPIGGGAATA